MPTFEVEVGDVDVQRYESMFPSLPDEKETEMADQVVAPIAPTPTFDLDADTVISVLMLVMAIAVALSVVLPTSDAAVVDDDDVFLIMAVGDDGLDSAWLVERIDYALSNLSCSIAGGMVVVGITTAVIIALGYSSTRKVAPDHGAAIDGDGTFESWYGATCGPTCTASDYSDPKFEAPTRETSPVSDGATREAMARAEIIKMAVLRCIASDRSWLGPAARAPDMTEEEREQQWSPLTSEPGGSQSQSESGSGDGLSPPPTLLSNPSLTNEEMQQYS
jgi:hypothetical protein